MEADVADLVGAVGDPDVGGFEVRTPGQPSFGTIQTCKEYPDRTRPGMLNELLSAPCRLVIHNSFRPHSRATTTGRLARKQAQLAAAQEKLAGVLAAVAALKAKYDESTVRL